jgi:tetratricopeptide (TPR) repeat protein
MSTILEDPKRRTVPRWRAWRDAVRLGDADTSNRTRVLEKPSVANLIKAKRDWEANPSVPFAADFLGAAYAMGEQHMAKDAAAFILTSERGTNQAVRDLADLVLNDRVSIERVLPDPPHVSTADRRLKIRSLRLSLREFPRDPLAFMDLAREYVALGQASAAAKAVETALALAPNSRFVLRSTSRFFLHYNQPDRAHSVLRRAAYVKTDPWLLAGEIAVASAANQTSSLIKVGRQIVESQKFAPFQISELASALGTLLAESGNRRIGKRFFRSALVEPTENVVAQAGWISRHIGEIELDPSMLNTPGSYEARTWAGLTDNRWNNSITAARFWLRDEPFAKRPAVFGSWAAMSISSDFKLAERFALHGLSIHRNESLLLNNLAVSLAYQGTFRKQLKNSRRLRSMIQKVNTSQPSWPQEA